MIFANRTPRAAAGNFMLIENLIGFKPTGTNSAEFFTTI
jgi:hypothetical protein